MRRGLVTIIGLVCIILCMSLSTAYAKTENYVGEKGFVLSGDVEGAKDGDLVTIVIVKDGTNWTDEAFWSNAWENTVELNKVVFSKETTILDGKYAFNIALAENGKYKAYVYSDTFGKFEEFEFNYVKKSENSNAVSIILYAASVEEIEEVLNGDALMLYDEIYQSADKAAAAAVLKNELDAMEQCLLSVGL